MKVCSDFSDHTTSSILSHTLSWIPVIAFVFTSRTTVLCVCGECDSVFFPVDRERKKEENKKQVVLGSFNVAANGFVWEVLYSVVFPVSFLYHTMTGIPWEPPHIASTQPHGFMFHHYLLMFGLFHTLGAVSCFLTRYGRFFLLEIFRNFLICKLAVFMAVRWSVYWSVIVCE